MGDSTSFSEILGTYSTHTHTHTLQQHLRRAATEVEIEKVFQEKSTRKKKSVGRVIDKIEVPLHRRCWCWSCRLALSLRVVHRPGRFCIDGQTVRPSRTLEGVYGSWSGSWTGLVENRTIHIPVQFLRSQNARKFAHKARMLMWL